jgi:pimeloyl-ACP methyl ester carboxylesterase
MINYYAVAAMAAERQKTLLAEARAARIANLAGNSVGRRTRHLRLDRRRHASPKAPSAAPSETKTNLPRIAFARRGVGETLVLLHGIGSSRHAWDPIVRGLAEQFDVIAIDLPGFGDSPAMPAQTEAHPAALAAAVAAFLDKHGITAPHVVGNSLGGWVALELAHIRPLRSLTLLSPAGLWKGATPRYCRASLRMSRWAGRRLTGPLCRLVRFRMARLVVLGQTHGRPIRMDPRYARMTIRNVGMCPGFEAALNATTRRHYQAGPPITAPVTVAFGTRDLLLLRRQSRHLGELPNGTHVLALHRCGHIPMADNPASVTELIAASAARARWHAGRTGQPYDRVVSARSTGVVPKFPELQQK